MSIQLPPAGYTPLTDALGQYIRTRYPASIALQDAAGADEDVLDRVSAEITRCQHEMLKAIVADELRIFVEDGASMRFLPAPDIAQASQEALFSLFVQRLHFFSQSVLASANGLRPLVHDGNFADWIYQFRNAPERSEAAAEMAWLDALAQAEWAAPESFNLLALESACGGERPWLSQVVNFMTFGTPWGPPASMPNVEVVVRQEPATRLLFESARRGTNRFIGLREGGSRIEEDIPAVLFDRDQVFRERGNTIDLALGPLNMETFIEVRNNPPPRWTNVRASWPHLRPWLIELGAIHRDDAARRADLQDAIYDDLERGIASPREAEKRRRVAGLPQIVQEPERETFNPMGEVKWTISMVVLWMAHSQLDLVVEGMDEFAVKCWYLRSKFDGVHYGPQDINELDQGEGYRIIWLNSDDLNRLLYFRPLSTLYRETFERLRNLILERQIKTFGVRADSRDVVEIPPFKWSGLWAFGTDDTGYYLAAEEKSGERFHDVWMRREDVPGLTDQIRDVDVGGQEASTSSAIEPLVATALERIASAPPISERELKSAFAEFKKTGEHFSRDAARAWFKARYGERVTLDRVDEVVKSEPRRGRGRPRKIADESSARKLS